MAKHLPQPYEDDPSARRELRGSAQPQVPRDPGVPSVPSSASRLGPPTHAARKLEFADLPGREYWWDLLGEAVQRRITQKVGTHVEWWAYCHDFEKQRPYAVVFGVNGLAVTTPTTNNAGRPAQLLRVRRFDPASVRYAVVVQQPSGGPGGSGDGASGGSVLDPGHRLPLTEDMRGFLGNLPAEVQARLQAPFLGDDPVQDSGYYYTGFDERLNVWCYLAGARTVTFASGLRVAPAGAPPRAASWEVICRMATVVRG